jgi:hypothetical protein
VKNSNLSACADRTSLSEFVSIRSTFFQGDSMAGTLPRLVIIAMAKPFLWLRLGACAVLVVLLAMQCGPAHGQGMGGGMGGGGMGGGGMGGGGMGGGGMGGGGMGGGGMTAGGVVIDANGVLRTRIVPDAGLSAERLKAAVAALPADLQTKSPLRKVALSRLEAELAKAAATGRGIPEELQKLAGLTRVQYVFIYPADGTGQDSGPGEVVIAGPAEPWATDATGRVVALRPCCWKISPRQSGRFRRASRRTTTSAARSIRRRKASLPCRRFCGNSDG